MNLNFCCDALTDFRSRSYHEDEDYDLYARDEDIEDEEEEDIFAEDPEEDELDS